MLLLADQEKLGEEMNGTPLISSTSNLTLTQQPTMESVCVSLCVRYWHASAYSYIYRNMITSIYAKLYKLFEISGHICTSAARVCSWCQGDIPRPVTGKIWDLHGLSYTQQLVQCDSPVPEKWGETQLQHSLAGLISILPRSQLDALIHCLCVSIFKESQWPHVYPVFVN